jgi:hypothetical protein
LGIEDKDAMVHVSVSVVLPSLVGMTTAQVDAKVGDDGMTQQLHMYHPHDWNQKNFNTKSTRWKARVPPSNSTIFKGK